MNDCLFFPESLIQDFKLINELVQSHGKDDHYSGSELWRKLVVKIDKKTSIIFRYCNDKLNQFGPHEKLEIEVKKIIKDSLLLKINRYFLIAQFKDENKTTTYTGSKNGRYYFRKEEIANFRKLLENCEPELKLKNLLKLKK